MTDPFARLGLPPTATSEEVRAAWRRLAKDHHPDVGGTADEMVALNDAARDALSLLAFASSPTPSSESGVCCAHGAQQTPDGPQTPDSACPGRLVTDVPSFTVEALPAETFEALLVVASWIGEVLDDDPPYRLDVHLYEPAECWCRLDVVPDAGSSTVSLTVGSVGQAPLPDVETVRDVWIAQLNQLDWE